MDVASMSISEMFLFSSVAVFTVTFVIAGAMAILYRCSRRTAGAWEQFKKRLIFPALLLFGSLGHFVIFVGLEVAERTLANMIEGKEGSGVSMPFTVLLIVASFSLLLVEMIASKTNRGKGGGKA